MFVVEEMNHNISLALCRLVHTRIFAAGRDRISRLTGDEPTTPLASVGEVLGILGRGLAQCEVVNSRAAIHFLANFFWRANDTRSETPGNMVVYSIHYPATCSS